MSWYADSTIDQNIRLYESLTKEHLTQALRANIRKYKHYLMKWWQMIQSKYKFISESEVHVLPK